MLMDLQYASAFVVSMKFQQKFPQCWGLHVPEKQSNYSWITSKTMTWRPVNTKVESLQKINSMQCIELYSEFVGVLHYIVI